MDNPETQSIFVARHITKKNKAKGTSPKPKTTKDTGHTRNWE